MQYLIIVIIGGIIDKIYFDDKLDYKIGVLQIGDIFGQFGVVFQYDVILILCKDSLYVIDEDCVLICFIIEVQLYCYVLVIYGIDIMVEMVKVLVGIFGKVIVFIGVLNLVCFQGFDVVFNIGCVVVVVQILFDGVYIIMNGCVWDLLKVCKNCDVNCFELVG